MILFILSLNTAKAGIVAVSIKPFYGLAAKLLKNTPHTLDLLYDGTVSPHTSGLTLAAAEKLHKAALFFWAGAIYETALAKQATALPTAIDLSKSKDLILLPHRTFERQPESCCSHHGEGEHHHDHETLAIDGHYWLDINNAKALVLAMKDALIKKFPSDKDVFEENAAKALNDLDILNAKLISTIKPRPYLCFHDFMQYFDHAFGTRCAGVMTTDAHAGLNLQHIHSLLQKATNAHIAFIIREKQFNTAILDKFKTIPVKTLDYLGTDLPLTSHLYEDIMKELAAPFTS